MNGASIDRVRRLEIERPKVDSFERAVIDRIEDHAQETPLFGTRTFQVHFDRARRKFGPHRQCEAGDSVGGVALAVSLASAFARLLRLEEVTLDDPVDEATYPVILCLGVGDNLLELRAIGEADGGARRIHDQLPGEIPASMAFSVRRRFLKSRTSLKGRPPGNLPAASTGKP